MTDETASSAWHSIWLLSTKEAQGSRGLTGPAPSGSRESTSSCSLVPAHKQGESMDVTKQCNRCYNVVLCMTCVTDCTCRADHAPWQSVWWWPGRWHPEPPSCALRHPGGEMHKLPGTPLRSRSFTQKEYRASAEERSQELTAAMTKSILAALVTKNVAMASWFALCAISASWWSPEKRASASARRVSALVSDISDQPEELFLTLTFRKQSSGAHQYQPLQATLVIWQITIGCPEWRAGRETLI